MGDITSGIHHPMNTSPQDLISQGRGPEAIKLIVQFTDKDRDHSRDSTPEPGEVKPSSPYARRLVSWITDDEKFPLLLQAAGQVAKTPQPEEHYRNLAMIFEEGRGALGEAIIDRTLRQTTLNNIQKIFQTLGPGFYNYQRPPTEYEFNPKHYVVSPYLPTIDTPLEMILELTSFFEEDARSMTGKLGINYDRAIETMEMKTSGTNLM